MAKTKKSSPARTKVHSDGFSIKTAHVGTSGVPIHPVGDRVVLKPLSAEEAGMRTASGIIIPDTAKEKPEQGRVVAVGPGKFEDGMRVPMNVKVGNRVLFSKYGFDEVKVNGVEYYVVSESNILAVLD